MSSVLIIFTTPRGSASAGQSFSKSHVMSFLSSRPFQNELPLLLNSFGLKFIIVESSLSIENGLTIGIIIDNKINNPIIIAPTTDDLFLQKRLKASLKNVVVFVSNFVSNIFTSD